MQITYRKLYRYKYKLTEDFTYQTEILGCNIEHPYIQLTIEGVLTVVEGYSWDGPSGPTIDTLSFMRASLVHDALYQLLREGLLPPEKRKDADLLLKQICIADGMSKIRATYLHLGVKLFAKRAATPGKERHPYIVFKVPADHEINIPRHRRGS